MNPFDLPGPQFLLFYTILFVVALAVGGLLRRRLRQPSDEPLPEALALSPYEIAYLQGGDDLVVNAAIARLVHDEFIAVDLGNRNLTAGKDKLPDNAAPIERALYSAVTQEGGTGVAALRRATAAALTPLRTRLEELGLLLTDDQAAAARWRPFLFVLLAPLIGVIKIFVGISRNRPVLFLVFLCIVSVVVTLLVLGRSVQRTRRGDRALAQLREDNAALEFQAGRRVDELGGEDLVRALGLFGMGILSIGPLSMLESILRPAPPSSSWGSSCGGSACGGGGCGGGCGGGGCGGCGG